MRVKNCTLKVKATGTEGNDDGTFEAIVATYDLDSYGDKIVPGAFKDTLAEWKAKGDPIPVLWSHMSYDPNAHIGTVLDAEERDGEGLWVKAQLDLDMPMAQQVYRLLKGRRVTQFSFAYDVEEGAWIEHKDEQPFYELRKMNLYEVGPCLIGVNQQTELLDVKGRDGSAVQVELRGRLSPDQSAAVRLAVETALDISPNEKAGRVLSAKNEETLKGALDSAKNAADAIKSVLAALDTSDDGKAATEESTTRKDDTEAKPGRSADDEEPPAGAKSDEPTEHRPASLRLRAELDAWGAEFDTTT